MERIMEVEPTLDGPKTSHFGCSFRQRSNYFCLFKFSSCEFMKYNSPFFVSNKPLNAPSIALAYSSFALSYAPPAGATLHLRSADLLGCRVLEQSCLRLGLIFSPRRSIGELFAFNTLSHGCKNNPRWSFTQLSRKPQG